MKGHHLCSGAWNYRIGPASFRFSWEAPVWSLPRTKNLLRLKDYAPYISNFFLRFLYLILEFFLQCGIFCFSFHSKTELSIETYGILFLYRKVKRTGLTSIITGLNRFCWDHFGFFLCLYSLFIFCVFWWLMVYILFLSVFIWFLLIFFNRWW